MDPKTERVDESKIYGLYWVVVQEMPESKDWAFFVCWAPGEGPCGQGPIGPKRTQKDRFWIGKEMDSLDQLKSGQRLVAVRLTQF